MAKMADFYNQLIIIHLANGDEFMTYLKIESDVLLNS